MVRKLLLIIACLNSFSIYAQEVIFDYNTEKLEISFLYEKTYSSLFRDRCTSFASENTIVQFIKRTDSHIYRFGAWFDGPFKPSSTPFFIKNTTDYYDKIQPNANITVGITKNTHCLGDIKEVTNSLNKVMFGDFNGDEFQDMLFKPQHSALKNKIYVFNSFKVNNLKYTEIVPSKAWFVPVPKFTYFHDISSIVPSGWQNANITIQDRNKDGRDDLLITRPGAPDLIAFAAPDGSFPKAEVDTGIGKYNGPSLYKSRFCNRALLTQHPEQNPSTVLFDDVCRTAYVSPPATGTTEVTALTPNPDNAAFCPKLATAQTNQTELLKELGQA
ncbi:hypothetical protein H0A36_28225, partial [Endozoicomonas sp. SM1973]